MSDFSFFSLFTAGLACLVPLTCAYTQPVGNEPKGNPIWTPGLHDVVPVGKPYTITWKPTTEGTVTLVLLKGPETDALPQYPIAQKIENTGSYIWVPQEDLAPGESGYGIQLICDSNGQYQYTTQFGISNSHYNPHASQYDGHSTWGSSATASASPSSFASSLAVESSGYAAPTGQWPHHNNTIIAHPTGWKPHNTTHAHPTGHVKHTWHHTTHKVTTHVPATTSHAPSTTQVAPSASATGGAATVATSFAGLVFAAGIVVLAL